MIRLRVMDCGVGAVVPIPMATRAARRVMLRAKGIRGPIQGGYSCHAMQQRRGRAEPAEVDIDLGQVAEIAAVGQGVRWHR